MFSSSLILNTGVTNWVGIWLESKGKNNSDEDCVGDWSVFILK